MVAVPLFGDQYGNAAALKDVGMAIILKYEDVTKENLWEAVDEITSPR